MSKNDIKYVFPPFFYIIKTSFAVKPEFLINKEDWLIINLNNKNLYFINKKIKNFLELFMLPQPLDEIRATHLQYKDSFVNSVLEHGFLIEFSEPMLPGSRHNRLIGRHLFYINQKPYYTVKSIKSNQPIDILIVKDQSHKHFVLKYVTSPEERFQAIFVNEFKIYKMLGNHDFFCKIEYLNLRKKIALLEYIDGTSLSSLITSTYTSLEYKQIIIKNLIAAYAFLHQKQIIHGDIHPGQIMVTPGYNIKLLDFGNAYHFKAKNTPKDVYYKAGIHYFLEPENISEDKLTKINNSRPAFQSDVYKIGILIYFIIYEEYPFNGFTWKEHLSIIAQNQIQLNKVTPHKETIPSIILQIISICLTKNSVNRFSSAKSIHDFLLENK